MSERLLFCATTDVYFNLGRMPKWLGVVNKVVSDWHIFYNYNDRPFNNIQQRQVELWLGLSYDSSTKYIVPFTYLLANN